MGHVTVLFKINIFPFFWGGVKIFYLETNAVGCISWYHIWHTYRLLRYVINEGIKHKSAVISQLVLDILTHLWYVQVPTFAKLFYMYLR
jgi:hypothetical protein